MLVAGVDVGSKTTKVVLLEDGEIVGQSILISPSEADVGARQAIEQALAGTGHHFGDLNTIVATGSGRKYVTFSHSQKASPPCLGRGAAFLARSVRTIFDIGAESSVVLRINGKGLVEEYQGHDRCASGTGVFLETMANKLLHIPLAEMAASSLRGERRAEISNMCAVFAEQEVISHIHRQPPTPANDVIRGIHGSMATRIAGLGKRIGVKPSVMVCGGVARNPGFIHELEIELKQEITIPENPEMVAALGAALSAVRRD